MILGITFDLVEDLAEFFLLLGAFDGHQLHAALLAKDFRVLPIFFYLNEAVTLGALMARAVGAQVFGTAVGYWRRIHHHRQIDGFRYSS